MITSLIFQDGDQRLEIECPNGGAARALMARIEGHFPAPDKDVIVRREIHTTAFSIDRVLETFNGGEDTFGREMKDKAKVKIVRIPDPGSVAGSYFQQ